MAKMSVVTVAKFWNLIFAFKQTLSHTSLNNYKQKRTCILMWHLLWVLIDNFLQWCAVIMYTVFVS